MANVFSHGDLTLGGALIHQKSLTGFPSNPKPFTQVIVNGVPYAYVDMSNGQGTLFSWLPMANKPNTFLHQQGVPSSAITVNHNLNTSYVGIFVYDADNKLQFANFDVVDANSITVNLAEEISCNIIVFGYNTLGAATVAGTTVKVGSITLADDNGSLTVDGQPVGFGTVTGDVYTKTEVDDLVESVIGLAPADIDTIKEAADRVQALEADKADKATTYTKTEVDSAGSTKADKATTYTKAEVDSAVSTKADKATTYTKTEVDSAVSIKADKATTYTKAEIDAKFASLDLMS